MADKKNFEHQKLLFENEEQKSSNIAPLEPSKIEVPKTSNDGRSRMVSTAVITKAQADKVLGTVEGQFGELKAIEVEPSKLTRTLSAFSNADGGDLYIGIGEEDSPDGKVRKWRGFPNPEAANGHIQCFETFFPLGLDHQYQFLQCAEYPGLVLHIATSKMRPIKKASNGIVYLRRGAQNLPVTDTDALKRLEYAKGLTSFEGELVNVDLRFVTESKACKEFIDNVVPQMTPEEFLTKQLIMRDGRPTVAAVLVFSDEPQAALPKHCGIKIYRYKTRAAEGFRDAMAFTPITIEGPLYYQIRKAVSVTIEKIEEIPKMGDESLEKITYPRDTLHEIIANAVLHRDYSITDDVHIRIFDNRIEVKSPGRLPANITVANILLERWARNGAIVRQLNRYPDPPNKDVGEGLKTAFRAMHALGLKEPVITEGENFVQVIIRHEPLASPEEAIMNYLEKNESITNSKAREITHIAEDHKIRAIFRSMVERGMICRSPGSATSNTKYVKPQQKP
jgi:ATP-dependent DNA helicase RecG